MRSQLLIELNRILTSLDDLPHATRGIADGEEALEEPRRGNPGAIE